ncbi:50S ribosome-binding GTPase [Popillia japonica]|uniref:50S ribosome-binding GTPase n=2 Tax=Popillia japonica TaxID=7064 RepID=A0AAW1KPI6_POPJA
MDRKVCPASAKVHTTRQKSCAIFTENDAQIVFLDTPGLVTDRERKRYKLEQTFIDDSNASLNQADIISVIHDVSNFWQRDRLDIKIINLLGKHIEKPSILILNKVDTLKSKRKLLDITRTITENCLKGKPTAVYNEKMLKYNEEMSESRENKKGWPYFSEVFMVSALTGNGLPEVKQYLIKEAKPNAWIYPDDVWSDQTAENIILASVKAKFLDFIPQEIPYALKPCMEYFDVDEKGIITTIVLVTCPTERIRKLVSGVSDGKLRQITESIQEDLQNTFHNFVRIKVVLEIPKQEEINK